MPNFFGWRNATARLRRGTTRASTHFSPSGNHPCPIASRSFGMGVSSWAVLRDARGLRKERPAIILTQTAEISTESPLVVMAVTTTFAEPPPENHVPLPWHPDFRRVGTRLAQRSAAVITWLDTLYPDEVIDVKGQV